MLKLITVIKSGINRVSRLNEYQLTRLKMKIVSVRSRLCCGREQYFIERVDECPISVVKRLNG